jgi:putative OmpL-like beta-barrel porin-2/carboxypeptidase family protein
MLRRVIATLAGVGMLAIAHPGHAQQAGARGGSTKGIMLPTLESVGGQTFSTLAQLDSGTTADTASASGTPVAMAILPAMALRPRVTAADAAAEATPGSGIVGTVHDPSGAAVTGADLTIRNLANEKVQSRTSDASGAFNVQNLTPGFYEVMATKDGFREANTTVVLAAHQQLHADLRLTPTAAAEETATPASKNSPSALETLETHIERLEAELAALKTRVGERAPAASAAGQAPPAAPAAPTVDEQTPFAFGDFTWLNGSPRNKKVAMDTPFFTPEVRFDTHYMHSLNHPIDHTLGGSTESFRSGEIQEEQVSVGGDFHMDNVRGRILTMYGLFATTTPRNDASPGVGQWDLRNAYRYVSEAYGGYHFNLQHGLNVDAGIFVSYIGLFSYYNFDNWTYQPSYVSSNTPWFFNGLRVQWFPTNKLKIEPWFINGWQSYGKPNNRLGIGGQILWQPTESLKLVFNNYGNGADAVGIPGRKRAHTDDSIELRYYNSPESTGISKMAFSFTADAGCEYGGGVTCNGGKGGPKQQFLGWMLYDRTWFHKDLFAVTLGGGKMTNPGRYLTLLPPINGADAFTGTPYFTESPGDQAHQWDATITFQYMPRDFITFWGEAGYRHSDVPYFAGPGGITPPGGNNGAPSSYVCSTGASAGTSDLTAAQAACGGGPSSVWFPDLRNSQKVLSMGILVKF